MTLSKAEGISNGFLLSFQFCDATSVFLFFFQFSHVAPKVVIGHKRI
jgi:hypothetical protein